MILLSVLLGIQCVQSANILGFFFYPGVSHQVFFQPIWRELSLRGHNVTVITPRPLKDPTLVNLTEIDVSFVQDFLNRGQMPYNTGITQFLFQNILILYNFVGDVIEAEFQHKSVQEIINNNNATYDVMILQSVHPLAYALAAKFKVPVIGISSISLWLQQHDYMGNPTHPVLYSDMFCGAVDTFYGRTYGFFYNIWYRIMYYWYVLPNMDKIARKYFGEDMPYLGDIERNVSLLITNVNPIFHEIRPSVPSMISVNQIHVREKKPLPEDIKKYLDSCTQGVIYFSLGSNVKSKDLPLEILSILIKDLSEIPYNVLWKWEADVLPRQPKNVVIRKWLPQQDVLTHPNIKVFVTQGGIQSAEEAIFAEVPMVGIPFFADQPSNVKRLEMLNIAIGINPTTIKQGQLKEAILEIASNNKYKKAIQKARQILSDQPMTGLETAVWWIEYVIRQKNVEHLKGQAGNISIFKYFMLDIISTIVFSVTLLVYIISKVFKYKRSHPKIKTN